MGDKRGGFSISASCPASLHHRLNVKGAWEVMRLDLNGEPEHTLLLSEPFHTPLVINSSTSHKNNLSVPIAHAALLYDKKKKRLKEKIRHFGYAVVRFKVCSDYNKV